MKYSLYLFLSSLFFISCGPDTDKAGQKILAFYTKAAADLDKKLDSLEINNVVLTPVSEMEMDVERMRALEDEIDRCMMFIDVAIEGRLKAGDIIASLQAKDPSNPLIDEYKSQLAYARKQIEDLEGDIKGIEAKKLLIGRNKSSEKNFYKAVFDVHMKMDTLERTRRDSCFLDKKLSRVIPRS